MVCRISTQYRSKTGNMWQIVHNIWLPPGSMSQTISYRPGTYLPCSIEFMKSTRQWESIICPLCVNFQATHKPLRATGRRIARGNLHSDSRALPMLLRRISAFGVNSGKQTLVSAHNLLNTEIKRTFPGGRCQGSASGLGSRKPGQVKNTTHSCAKLGSIQFQPNLLGPSRSKLAYSSCISKLHAV